MPYIPKADRPRVAAEGALNAGELNYELTLVIRAHIRDTRGVGNTNYATINEVIAALDWAKGAFRCPAWGSKFRCNIHRICANYVARNARYEGHIRINDPEGDALGALECCKLEFYRRVAAPYEDSKIKSNGDCY